MMREIILFSILSFVLILFGVLYLFGFIVIGPVPEPVKQEDNTSLERVQLAAMEAQKANLERKRAEVVSLTDDLELERKLIVEERRELEELLNRIEQSSLDLDGENLTRINKLAKLYESMRPEKAAVIVSSLDIRLLIDIVSRMNEKKAAKMLAEMSPKVAAEISRRLGKRNKK